jgi:RelB Antitoxin alpha helical domain
MLELHKNYIPIAVQIPIAKFEMLEEMIENYGLAKLMENNEDSDRLSKAEALKYLSGNRRDTSVADRGD